MKGRKKVEIGFVGTEIWDSGLKIVKNPIVRIPLQLQLVCNTIQKRVNHKEFSVLARGRWTSEGFEVSEDYVIPEQEVTSSSVDYLEPLENYKKQGYNVVIHSHPWGYRTGTDFSSSDEETINTHFDCSILFDGEKFCKAVLSIQVNNSIKLQINAKIEIVYPEITIPQEELAKIKEKKVVTWSPWKDLKERRDYDGYFLF